MGVTQSYAGLVVCRFFLGLCEAGFFPGETTRQTRYLDVSHMDRMHVLDVDVLPPIRITMEVQSVLLCCYLGWGMERGAYPIRPYQFLLPSLTLSAAARIRFGEDGWDRWL